MSVTLTGTLIIKGLEVGDVGGSSFTIKLISATKPDPVGNGLVKLEDSASSEGTLTPLTDQPPVTVTFPWSTEEGIPGAFLIWSHSKLEFLLVSLSLDGIPNHAPIYFDCNSWVYPEHIYEGKPRIFFYNKSYLPSQTPEPLRRFREIELVSLRGNGTGERQIWQRIYDYDVYNDLGNPDLSQNLARPVLGGSSKYPYPRRGRTGRPPTNTDPNSESRVPEDQGFSIYVPRDERFSDVKLLEFISYFPKSVISQLKPFVKAAVESQGKEFDSFKDEREILYKNGFKFNVPKLVLDVLAQNLPIPTPPADGNLTLLFPTPSVIQESLDGWMTDEEFARQMLAGVNPNLIRLLQEFPPKSNLDVKIYGDQNSKITKAQVEINLNGLTVEEALKSKRLFILDHHDGFIPFLRLINNDTSRKAYATRTILFLKDDGTLKPLAIELSLPHPDGDRFGAVSKVYLPADEGVEASFWFLAKAYVVVNDSGYHQLISHWLNTHAAIEPFIIATNRHLSVLHPINKLLHPHFKDNMFINALARENLISANGIIETSFLPEQYSMEVSSEVYKNWIFPEQALPADLIKRGVAVEDSTQPHRLRLLIEDYPYAVDGLDIWAAIEKWVQDYVNYYYEKDDTIQQDFELQKWWEELVEVGHGDLADKPWWPKMQTRKDLIDSCSIIIWCSSALHAAVNFGQFPYGGYIPNRPTLSRRFIPEKGTPEYDELLKNPEVAFLKTITPKYETLLDLSIIEILSGHTTDEVYLGTRNDAYWTSDVQPLAAFKEFGKKITEIGDIIIKRNEDPKLKNRVGSVKMPYTLLYPSSEPGLTGKGIPNSISI